MFPSFHCLHETVVLMSCWFIVVLEFWKMRSFSFFRKDNIHQTGATDRCFFIWETRWTRKRCRCLLGVPRFWCWMRYPSSISGMSNQLKDGKKKHEVHLRTRPFFLIPCWISWASLLVSRSNFSAPCGSTFDIPKLQSPVWPILIVPRETAHSSWFHFSVPLEMGLTQTMPASIFLDDFLCEKIVSENKHSLESGFLTSNSFSQFSH